MLSKSLTNFLLMDGAVFPPCSLPGAKLWWDFLGGSEGKVSVFDAGDLGSVPALEKEMATHSSVLAWRIAGPEEPGGLPSMG